MVGRPCARAQEVCMHLNVLVRVSAIVGCIATCTVSTSSAADTVSDWNVIAVQSAAAAGQNAIVASRTLAIAQIAVHDALNAIDARYERYAFTGTAFTPVSLEAVVAAAARDALVGAIAVGSLPFVGFGTVASQSAAVAQIDAAYLAALAAIA